jgi:hypothetical protein
MSETLVCNRCGEELPEEPIRLGNLTFCCQACAYEASRSQDCGGRTDVHISQPPEELELPK